MGSAGQRARKAAGWSALHAQCPASRPGQLLRGSAGHARGSCADVLQKLADEYISLLFQVIVTPRSTVEHEYVTALLGPSAARSHPLFEGMEGVRILHRDYEVDAAAFLEGRGEILQRKLHYTPRAGRAADCTQGCLRTLHNCSDIGTTTLGVASPCCTAASSCLSRP